MSKKTLLLTCLALCIVAIGMFWLMPAPALLVPATLPPDQRADHRLLNFEGIANFRDLGGYPTTDGRLVKWGILYRSGTLAHGTDSDLAGLAQLGLTAMVDFRSAVEKEEEPDRLPQPLTFDVVEIPTLDDGNKVMVEIMQRIESGNFGDMDPNRMMLDANRQFASTFTPQYRQFIRTVQATQGTPILWHCSAGKDRAGFAAAILLRILGVPEDIVLQDYMASSEHALEARKAHLLLLRLFRGREAADKMATLMGVEDAWLQAGFEEIDAQWGNFDRYVRDGLALSAKDVQILRDQLLETPPTLK
ncbi:MAG: tyrosine-protein phosphatase [Halioglobus sp.]|nr:tyrosine-protein phosphatase [Halioglobus sp.]